MSAPTPVVALHRTPTNVAERVRVACDRAGARVVSSDVLGERAPALLVAHLPHRARRIPRDVLELAERFDASLPILLACDEALVNPATTLRLGGVTLVEHAAIERLYSQIRILLTAAVSGTDARAPAGAIEQAGPDWWFATTAGKRRPGIARDGALSLLLPLRPVADPAALLSEAHAVVASAPDVASSLVRCLGADAGLVHLTTEPRRWVIYWPAGAGGLRLFSSHRLPHLSDLSGTSDAPRVFRSQASPGEVVVATSRPLEADGCEVLAGLPDGGPVTIDRLRALSSPPDGFVVEVR